MQHLMLLEEEVWLREACEEWCDDEWRVGERDLLRERERCARYVVPGESRDARQGADHRHREPFLECRRGEDVREQTIEMQAADRLAPIWARLSTQMKMAPIWERLSTQMKMAPIWERLSTQMKLDSEEDLLLFLAIKISHWKYVNRITRVGNCIWKFNYTYIKLLNVFDIIEGEVKIIKCSKS